MASSGVGGVGETLGNLSGPKKMVFGDIGQATVVAKKDFYWDQIIFVLISTILGLSLLDISIEFFRGSEVQCFFDIDNFTISKGNYINSYCYGSLPNTQYYLVYTLITALLIIAPHYLWNAYFAAYFDFFFSLVKNFDRLRDANTGEYSQQNFERVRKVEERFGESKTLFYFYILKIVAQLLFCAISLLFNAFYFKAVDFDEEFDCPRNCVLDSSGMQSVPNCSDLWPLDEQLKCVYNPLRLFKCFHNVMFFLLVIIIFSTIFGSVRPCMLARNYSSAKKIANFCFMSCLYPESSLLKKLNVGNNYYQKAFSRQLLGLTPLMKDKNSTEGKERQNCQENFCFQRVKTCLNRVCNYIIIDNIDFLLILLYTADFGHGQVFREIQILEHLHTLVFEDLKRLFLSFKHYDYKDRFYKIFERDPKRLATYQRENPQGFLKSFQYKNYKSGWKEWKDLSYADLSPHRQSCMSRQYECGISVDPKTSKSPKDCRLPCSLVYMIRGFFQFAPNNQLAMDISFGTSTGYFPILATTFDHVIITHFNRFYKNQKDVCQVQAYQRRYWMITFQDDIFHQNDENITKSKQLLEDVFTWSKHTIDLLLIGPFCSESMRDTIFSLIGLMWDNECFSENAILLAIRPLKIGLYDCTADYCKFQPCEWTECLFGMKERVDDFISYLIKILEDSRIKYMYKPVEGSETCIEVQVECDDIECNFEFQMFQFLNQRK